MTPAVLTLLAGLLVIASIIAANGYFVAQEFAFMAVDRSRLRAAADAGDARARRALDITSRTSFLLSGAQLGITVTGLLIGYVAEPLVGGALGTILGGVGVPVGVSVAVGTVLALAISTVVQMIVGELFPKNWTIAAPTRAALALAGSTRVYLTLMGWLIRGFDLAANALLRLIGVEPVQDVDDSATPEDLGHILESSRESGEISDAQYLALDRVLDFPDQHVGHAMIPRSRSDVVHPATTVGEVRALMSTQHTRYPVIDEEHTPIGVVHMLDLLRAAAADDEPVTTIMREPLVLPELMPLPEATRQLLEHGERLACVIDEYGGFEGLLTVEDLAEEILGDLADEHDEPERDEIVRGADGRWLVDGDVHVDEVQRAIALDLPEGEYETLSGLLIAHAGGFVEEGDVHTIELPALTEDLLDDEEPPTRTLRLTVEQVDRHVPSQVRVEVVEEQP